MEDNLVEFVIVWDKVPVGHGGFRSRADCHLYLSELPEDHPLKKDWKIIPVTQPVLDQWRSGRKTSSPTRKDISNAQVDSR